MVRNTVKLDNLDVRPLSVEIEALLKCNSSSPYRSFNILKKLL